MTGVIRVSGGARAPAGDGEGPGFPFSAAGRSAVPSGQ